MKSIRGSEGFTPEDPLKICGWEGYNSVIQYDFICNSLKNNYYLHIRGSVRISEKGGLQLLDHL